MRDPVRHVAAFVLVMLTVALLSGAGQGPQADGNATATRTIALHEFKTSSPPPAYKPPNDLRGFYSRFRPMLGSTKERVLVELGLEFGLTHGRVTEAQRKALGPQLKAIYEEMEQDAGWKDIPTPLAFSFADEATQAGQYLMVVPQGADDKTAVVIYLHGDGGLMQSHVELISRHLPEVILLAPAWRASWREGSPGYVEDMLVDAEARLGFKPHWPTLLGLSDGAQAAFRMVGRQPDAYRQLISLALSPRQSLVNAVPESLPVLMINGVADDRVNIEHARLRAGTLESRLKAFTFVEVPGDHFFLLLEPDSAFGPIRAFLGLPPTN